MTANNMSPDSSPGSLKSGTKRVNNMPLMIVGAVAVMFLLVMLSVGIQRAAKQREAARAVPETPKAGNTVALANAIVAGAPAAFIPPRTDQPPQIPPLDAAASTAASTAPASGAVGIARPNLELPPAPPGHNLALPQGQGSYAAMTPRDDAQSDRIRQAKEQMFLDAVKARPGVPFDTARSAGNSGSSYAPSTPTDTPLTRDEMLDRLAAVRRQLANVGKDDPTAAYKQRLAQLQSSGLVPVSATAGGLTAGSNPGMTGALAALAGGAGRNGTAGASADAQSGDRFRLNAEVQAPESRFELRAPSLIPAVLISGINSELKGPIFAQVSRDVFDSATHQYLLIPQGSKLYGEYDSQVAYGQSRVLVAWNRVVFPDGKALDIGSMPGVDASGYSGFNDQVNNHYVRIFSSAILLSGITAGVAIATNQNQTTSAFGTTQQSTSSAISQALGQQLGQVSAQMIQKNMNVAPTLEIRPGYRFNIVVVKDLVFSKPYQAFDY
jgi:type IV secretion system protein VirB10